MYMTYAHCRSSFNNFCTYISTGLANCTKHNLDCMCMIDGYDFPRQLFFLHQYVIAISYFIDALKASLVKIN